MSKASGDSAFLLRLCGTSVHLCQSLQVRLAKARLPRWCELPQLPLLQVAAEAPRGRGGEGGIDPDLEDFAKLCGALRGHSSSTGA